MILIGVPCGDTIKSRTAFSLMNLVSWDATPFMARGCDVADNRNKIVAHALDKDYSHILFVDSDMEFNSDTLQRMLVHGKDIVGLAANHRKLPLESVVKPLDGDITKPLPTELFEAESCGTGVMLVKTSVFRKMYFPWFEFSYNTHPVLERIGEDVNFCRKAREHAYKIWVDPTIPVRHIGEYLY